MVREKEWENKRGEKEKEGKEEENLGIFFEL